MTDKLYCPYDFLTNVKSVSGDELSEPSRKRRKHDSGPSIQCQICDLSLSGDVQHYSHYLSAHPDQPDLHPPRLVYFFWNFSFHRFLRFLLQGQKVLKCLTLQIPKFIKYTENRDVLTSSVHLCY